MAGFKVITEGISLHLFCIICPRWIFTVVSLASSLAAICLFEHSGNHQIHNFTLACAKPGIARLQVSQLSLFFAKYALLAERAESHRAGPDS